MLVLSTAVYAQTGHVGVNTSEQKTTMDTNGQKDSYGNVLNKDMTGMQAPRISRAEQSLPQNEMRSTVQLRKNL